MSPEPNENGVYAASEVLELQRPVKGWRGMPIAEIRLVDLGSHWLWATSFSLWTGDWWGSSSPLMDVDGRRAGSRADAISKASEHLRNKLSARVGEYPDARAIVTWLDTLAPAQFDLFGAAA